MGESETSYGVSILLILQARWVSGVSNLLSLGRGHLSWARSENISIVSTHKWNWEKYFAVCFSIGKGHFQGVYFSQLLVFRHPHAAASFLLIQLLYLALFYALFLLIHLSPSLMDSTTRKKKLLQQWLSTYQCFSQRLWFLPPTLPHIKVLAPSFDLRNLSGFASFHLDLYVPIALCKRK